MLSGLPLSDCEFVAVDLETTGCSPGRHSIIEIGAVRMRAGVVHSEFSSLVRPSDPLPRAITQLTGITHEMLSTAPSVDEVVAAFRAFAAGAVLVAHNYRFDLGFLDYEAERLWGEPFPRPAVDTLFIARRLYPELERYSLLFLANRIGTSVRPDHRAGNDARAAAEILAAMLPDLAQRGLTSVGDLATFCGLPDQHALASRLPLTVGIPDTPGVYVFRDPEDRVLYVGRAKDLRQRVRGHFYPAGTRAHTDLGCLVAHIRAIPTASSLDAALLERRLLTRHDPPFNAPSQRPRSLYYLHIDTSSAFPAIRVVTKRRKRGVTVGPVTSRWAARMLADRLAEVYGLRRCARRLDARLTATDCELREGGCPAPCASSPDPVEYRARVLQVLAVFDGGGQDTRETLTSLQEQAAGESRYEDAIRFRDAVRALDRALSTLSVMRNASEHDAVLVEHCGMTVTVHLVRGGLRACVLRGTPELVAERLPRALHGVYYDDRPRPDLLDLEPPQIAELLTIAAFAAGDAHIEIPIADERLSLATVRRSLGIDRRQPRRRHAMS
ncbi:MAG: exonuclease domain-containing protein [Coriobacteriia bacterium]|nr:exonuclease domain-containing protein [Coriobacteriia bacterium]